VTRYSDTCRQLRDLLTPSGWRQSWWDGAIPARRVEMRLECDGWRVVAVADSHGIKAAVCRGDVVMARESFTLGEVREVAAWVSGAAGAR